MDKALQKYYEARFDMMASVGWKDLIEDISKMTENYNELSSIDSVEKLYFRKGQLDILTWLLNLKPVSEEAWKELNGEKDV